MNPSVRIGVWWVAWGAALAGCAGMMPGSQIRPSHYHGARPHSALNNLTPEEFVSRSEAMLQPPNHAELDSCTV